MYSRWNHYSAYWCLDAIMKEITKIGVLLVVGAVGSLVLWGMLLVLFNLAAEAVL